MNPNHDELGRFTSGSSSSVKPSELRPGDVFTLRGRARLGKVRVTQVHGTGEFGTKVTVEDTRGPQPDARNSLDGGNRPPVRDFPITLGHDERLSLDEVAGSGSPHTRPVAAAGVANKSAVKAAKRELKETTIDDVNRMSREAGNLQRRAKPGMKRSDMNPDELAAHAAEKASSRVAKAKAARLHKTKIAVAEMKETFGTSDIKAMTPKEFKSNLKFYKSLVGKTDKQRISAFEKRGWMDYY